MQGKQIIVLVLRILAGLFLVVIGLDKWVPFFPHPPAGPAALAFKDAMAATGYFLPLVGTVEILAGLMLLSGRFIALALLLLAPLCVNFLFFHIFLDMANIGGAIGFTLLTVYLAYERRELFAPLLRAK